jgi:hypothetical protein
MKIVLAAIMAASAVAGCCAYPAIREFSSRTVLSASALSGTTADGWRFNYDDTHCEITGTANTVIGDVTVPANITVTVDGAEKTLPVTVISGLRFNSRITGLTIPEGVQEISEYALAECPNLTTVSLPSSLLVIGGSAFGSDTALETVSFSEGIREVGGYAFKGCSSLKSVKLPSTLTTIGRDAFNGCVSLTSANIPGKVAEPGPWAFAGCKALEKVTIEDGVKKLANTFDGCTNLTELDFPASVSTLGYPFDEDCTHLTSVSVANPDCEITFRKFAAEDTVTIYGYEGSTAEKYVTDLGEQDHIVFKSMGEKPVKPEVPDTGAFCDADGDGKISTGDAQYVLIYATESMTGNHPSWRKLTGNEKAPE